MARARSTALLCVSLVAIVGVTAAGAEPVRMKYPEGPAHGFIVLSEAGKPIAHGELIQWLERAVVASQLVIRFDDGSLYDEVVRFTQRPVFRVQSYRLVQRGPSFGEHADIEFDRSGQYRVRRRAKPGEEEQHAAGHVDLPEDVSNGMTSTLLKNLMPHGSATTHVVVFRPKPLVLELRLAPEGIDTFWVGTAAKTATRFRLQPEVRGLTGVVATLVGKQPPPLDMWIARGHAPVLVRFEGPLYTDGPSWRIELSAPRWEPSAAPATP